MFAILNSPEIILILVVCLILFGAKKLPEFARGLGQGVREFKRATRDLTDSLTGAIEELPAAKPTRLSETTTAPLPAVAPTEQLAPKSCARPMPNENHTETGT